MNTIVKFAILSNKHNQSEYAHALLEQVLTSYPKRVDIWTTYIDMLVKADEILLARYVDTIFIFYKNLDDPFSFQTNIRTSSDAKNSSEKDANDVQEILGIRGEIRQTRRSAKGESNGKQLC